MRLNGFDLNQIICLDALLSERNVTRAAERVYLSQSALSTVLAQLRKHFDDPLLVRSGRSLVLTPFAKTLVAPLREVLGKAQVFSAMRPNATTDVIDRELKIVASDYSMSSFLADAIRDSAANQPKLRFDILPLSERSAQLLSAGEIDLMFAGQVLDVGVPPNTSLFEDHFVCLACSEAFAATEQMSQAEYLAQTHVVVRYFDHQLAFEDEDALRKAGLRRARHISVWSHSMVPSLVCGTSMIATVPSRIAHQIAQRWPVRIFPFPVESEPIRVFAYWHPSRDEDMVLKRFVASISER
ncbi:LysR family transcriptional regulator [uncultured Roseobacter sp.]|uniref:LysR family transcriptional regulator n=1 Tax=uncultured Roseobacter sp. TaxID=114847 RepID=UPI00261866D5|nr:LysR family transcriptional regulator [uncultured Roseobacter sp.]